MAKTFPRKTSQATKRSGFTQPRPSKARHSHNKGRGKTSAKAFDNNRFGR